MSESRDGKALYFGSLEVEGVKCFEGREVLELSRDGKPSLMNVILGNNGMGKTTLLTCLLGMVPEGVPNPNPKEGGATIAVPLRHLRDFPRFFGKTSCTYLAKNGQSVGETPNGKAVINLQEGEDSPYVRFYTEVDTYFDFRVWAYNANRFIGRRKKEIPTTYYSFFHDGGMIDVEEYLLDLDYGRDKKNQDSVRYFELIESAVKSIVPGIRKLTGRARSFGNNLIEVESANGARPFYNMSLGYQVMLTMTIDICRILIGHYPKSENPFDEPAVVLIDEIDLHLHPTWQQRILVDLREAFPNVQFIVTTHSPLVVQNASEFNLAILDGGEGGVKIRNIQGANLQGWTVEEILEDVMGVKDASSQAYLNASKEFERAIGDQDREAAEKAYQELAEMLPPDSVKPELMRFRISGIRPKARA